MSMMNEESTDDTFASEPNFKPTHNRRTHARSVSHGGILIHRDFGVPSNNETSVSFSRGHQRAHSQGQVTVGKGHQRQGSKTNFVLPDDHEQRVQDRELRNKRGSVLPSGGTWKRGHNRQTSRTDSVYSIRNQKVSWIRSWLFGRRKQDDHAPRFIYPTHAPSKRHDNAIYPGNRICTRKYSIISFIPKNLYEQFHRLANLYFLFIVLLNFVPSINAFAKELAITPLLFVLGVTAIKDAFEDRRRYLSDKQVNNTFCRVYSNEDGRYVKRYWKDVRVGDIVHLSCDELIPADIVLLNSSDDHGICYIESSNLDGEITLKQRFCVKGLHQPDEEFIASNFDGHLEIGPPSTKIYYFAGSMRLRSGEKLPLTKENLILRDCVLKNTDFVEGIVVYAGLETKAMLNNGGPRYKRSRLEKKMNIEVGLCVAILIIICLISATGAGFWQKKYSLSNGVIPFIVPPVSESNNIEQSPIWVAFTSFWSFIIIYQVLIPISLYVTIEIIKLMQIYHIQADEKFVDKKTGQTIKCRALNIPEELGQVEYVFADKTGTLTENNMVFRRCLVNGEDFDHTPPSGDLGRLANKVIPNDRLQEKFHSVELKHVPKNIGGGSFLMTDDCQRLHDFFFTLAAANTVVVSKRPHRDTLTASGMIIPPEETEEETPTRTFFTSRLRNILPISRLSPIASHPPSPVDTPRESPKHSPHFSLRQRITLTDKLPEAGIVLKEYNVTSEDDVLDNLDKTKRPNTLHLNSSPLPRPLFGKPFYEAESPDELALVEAAYSYGVRLLRRSLSGVLLSTPAAGTTEYEILHILPFDSNRKRMSVVVRDPETGNKILYCKGADSAILTSLRNVRTIYEQRQINYVEKQLAAYARIGLRVLCMAKRKLPDMDYKRLSEKLSFAENAVQDRERLLLDAYNDFERDLELLGATGIEDKLQERVPETIRALRLAGIVVYVLTGDKQETAINIAYSCCLFTSDMQILKLCARTKRETEDVIYSYLRQAELEDEVNDQASKKRGLVVDGRTLVYILDRRANLRTAFLGLAIKCTAILCCRATPLQKALVVRLAKDKLKALCLAVGDGANDVSMIQTADVGIGISGVEGRQAVMASDYAISRFCHLERLLLVHGHWCYERLAKTILYFFYKNASFVFLLLLYQLYCGYSGTVQIEQMYLITFNMMFTSLPAFTIGIYNQVAPEKVLLEVPALYSEGRLGQVYGSYSFLINMVDAFYQSAAIFFMNTLAYDHSDTGVYEFGLSISHICLVVQLLHISIETNSWTCLSIGSLICSYVLFVLFSVAYTVACNGCLGLPSMVGEFTHLVSDPIHWMVLFVSVVATLLPRFTVRSLQASLQPNDITKTLLKRRCHRSVCSPTVYRL